MLHVEDVTAGYGRTKVLDGINLDLERGQVLAVVGPNGAGKSTLMRAISGAIPLWKGRIHCDGTELTAFSVEERCEFGVVLCPEGRRIFSSLSVEENLVLGANPARQRQGYVAALRAGLERAYTLFPILNERRRASGGALSGGQQQMLAIARALMSNPRLLLLDEPSLGLSPKLADQVYVALAALKAGGLTTIIVEEAVGRPLALAEEGIVMRGGCIVRRESARSLAAGNLAFAYLGPGSA
jgi:branched-chain amino acid transport system ATP-binding protein